MTRRRIRELHLRTRSIRVGVTSRRVVGAPCGRRLIRSCRFCGEREVRDAASSEPATSRQEVNVETTRLEDAEAELSAAREELTKLQRVDRDPYTEREGEITLTKARIDAAETVVRALSTPVERGALEERLVQAEGELESVRAEEAEQCRRVGPVAGIGPGSRDGVLERLL